MSDLLDFETRTADLRHAFDRSFALPPGQASADVDDLLAIRVAGARYGVRLREASGLVARRRVIPVPNGAPHLLGVAGIRGAIVPAFSLASILGHRPPSQVARWMILCGVEAPIGLGFSEFDGHLRLPSSAFHAGDPTGLAAYVREVASTEGGALPVISIPLVIAALRDRNGQTRLEKEP